ncbi:MarR family winged helix-turn-helix transcriptional regulator [Martelella soudanensis]|uniref:MarR family winged helix-turn-helix transcriptional regulator n=1 Tax=unclassified Martelella TaxID=2629616 RepID=UPI0015DE539F|nr:MULTISPECIES: MarR family winged helix-turn-helix transcriptional regulator [unclassified Martelella]
MKQDKNSPAKPAEKVFHGGSVILNLDDWIPYQFSYISNQTSLYLEELYNSRFGLSVTGWRVMANLAIHSPLSAKEVAAHTAMDQVQVTRAINQLHKIGMISRRTDSHDRRKVVLRLSQRGAEVYATIAPYAIEIERRLLAELSAAEVETLRNLTSKVVAVAKEVFKEQDEDNPKK